MNLRNLMVLEVLHTVASAEINEVIATEWLVLELAENLLLAIFWTFSGDVTRKVVKKSQQQLDSSSQIQTLRKVTRSSTKSSVSGKSKRLMAIASLYTSKAPPKKKPS